MPQHGHRRFHCGIYRKAGQVSTRGLQDADMLPARPPDIRIGRAEKGQCGRANGRRQVPGTRIVADKQIRLYQGGSQAKRIGWLQQRRGHAPSLHQISRSTECDHAAAALA